MTRVKKRKILSGIPESKYNYSRTRRRIAGHLGSQKRRHPVQYEHTRRI